MLTQIFRKTAVVTNTAFRGFATHTRVAVVGGGCAGTSVSKQLLNSGHFKPGEITVFDSAEHHYYQPGFTNLSGGVWDQSQADKSIRRTMSEVLDSRLNHVRENVTTYQPEMNSITTTSQNEFTYDYLIVASGLDLRYDTIEGAIDAIEDPDCPVGSMYSYKYA